MGLDNWRLRLEDLHDVGDLVSVLHCISWFLSVL